MSLILKGIDLPKEGEKITLAIFHDGDIVSYKYWLPKDSQAIQIDRPHGRLIDGDWFIESNECCGWIEDMTVETFNKLTPTILEAEE